MNENWICTKNISPSWVAWLRASTTNASIELSEWTIETERNETEWIVDIMRYISICEIFILYLYNRRTDNRNGKECQTKIRISWHTYALLCTCVCSYACIAMEDSTIEANSFSARKVIDLLIEESVVCFLLVQCLQDSRFTLTRFGSTFFVLCLSLAIVVFAIGQTDDMASNREVFIVTLISIKASSFQAEIFYTFPHRFCNHWSVWL